MNTNEKSGTFALADELKKRLHYGKHIFGSARITVKNVRLTEPLIWTTFRRINTLKVPGKQVHWSLFFTTSKKKHGVPVESPASSPLNHSQPEDHLRLNWSHEENTCNIICHYLWGLIRSNMATGKPLRRDVF